MVMVVKVAVVIYSPALLLSRQFQVIQVLLLQLAVLNHSL